MGELAESLSCCWGCVDIASSPLSLCIATAAARVCLSSSSIESSGSYSKPFSLSIFLFNLSSDTQRPSSGCFTGGLGCPFWALKSTSFWNIVSKSNCRQDTFVSSVAEVCFNCAEFVDFCGSLSATMCRSSVSSDCSKNGISVVFFCCSVAISFGCCCCCSIGEPSGISGKPITITSSFKSSTPAAAAFASFSLRSFSNCITKLLALISFSFRSFSNCTALKVPSSLDTRLCNPGTLTPALLTWRLPA
mmetsp:Transcript_6771/g.14665  ORF Transcript_6771/g.14665 Transcript_6771/m.14665 type:complete len:248 (-) Transcript_6771:874-1617(-)